MNIWKKTVVVAALALAGCDGKIGAKGSGDTGTGATTGSGASTGVGSNTGFAGTSGGGGTFGTVPPPTMCVPGVPATSQLPRLTRVQYDNTIRDLLQITSQPSSMLAPDTTGPMDQRAWDGFQAAAEALSTQVMADTALRGRVIPCTPTGDGAACARMFIEQFGRRAYRRPLTTAEIDRYMAIYTSRTTITAGGTFDQAAQVILKAFLESPGFLTKAELSSTPEGSYFALDGYEIASRLSYMLWGSMPDDALFAAAAANALSTPQQIRDQAQRMLMDSKARAKVATFHQQYAHMGEGTRWVDIMRDPALYPTFNPAMTSALSQETSRFFDYIVFDAGGSFKDMFTSNVGFVNATLAPLYGLNPAQYGATLTQVNLDPATRAGVFTRAGFLTSYSLYDRASPILRGAFIQKDVLCRTIPMPDNSFFSTPLPPGAATNRERVDQQTAGGECVACHHEVINPTGFALEAFDAIGMHQTTEKGTGAAINTEADVLIGGTKVHVTGPADLMNKIAASPEAAQCYAQKWVQYAYERPLTSQDLCTVQDLAGKMGQGSYSVVNMIADLTQSQQFRYRAKELP